MQKSQWQLRQLLSLGQTGLLLCWFSTQPILADTPQTSTEIHQTEATKTARDEAFIHQLVSLGIQPLYRELEQSSQQLTQTSTEFCNDTALHNFQKLRAAWGATMLAWQRTDTLLFGPAIAEQMDFHINFTPPKKQVIKSLLASPQPLTLESVAAAGVGAQGLSSLEYVLFDREQTTEQLLTNFKERQGQIRCSYIQAVSALLEDSIKKVTTPWLKGDGAKVFSSNQAAIDLLIGKSYQTLEKINLKKIRTPFGLMDAQQLSQPYELEAWRSGYSFKIIQANIDGIRRVFIEGGFLAWIAKTFPTEASKIAVNSFEKQLNDWVDMQLPIGDPFTLVEQKLASPERIALVERCRSLEMGIKRQLAVITQAQLGFNDNDGD